MFTESTSIFDMLLNWWSEGKRARLRAEKLTPLFHIDWPQEMKIDVVYKLSERFMRAWEGLSPFMMKSFSLRHETKTTIGEQFE